MIPGSLLLSLLDGVHHWFRCITRCCATFFFFAICISSRLSIGGWRRKGPLFDL
jgi:hypothetical protein